MKHKITAILLIPLFLAGLNLQASEKLSLPAANYEQLVAHNLTSVVFSQMEEEGLLDNLDDETLAVAKEAVKFIISDDQLFQNYMEGDLNLDDEIFADYFLGGIFDKIKKAAETVGKGVKKAAETVGKGVKTAAETVAKGVKTAAEKAFELAKQALPAIKTALSKIAHYANVAISTIKDNKVVNNILMTSIGVLNKVIEVGAPIIGPALTAVPYVGPVLGPLVTTVLPMLNKVVTPTNVQKALEVASLVTKTADALLDPHAQAAAAALAPRSDLASISQKPTGREAVNQAALAALRGTRELMKYYAQLTPEERARLPKTITDAIDKGRKLMRKVGT